MTSESDLMERREYFRVKNWIIINHETLDSIESAPPIEDTQASASPKINLLHSLNQIDIENRAYLSSLSEKQSQLGNYLLNLDKKIDLLTQFVVQTLEADDQELTEVDISGGGIRFGSQTHYPVDQLIKVELVLVPECVGVVAYARVVKCTAHTDGSGYDLALLFVKLKEAHRDAIVRHVFQVQSQQLRSQEETSD